MAGGIAAAAPEAPVSWGELIDKITILEIKKARILRKEASVNVSRELELLIERAAPAYAHPLLAPLKAELAAVNQELWEVEDKIRLKEKAQDFGLEFVELARSVYLTNDRRAAIKRRINHALGSVLIEEKSYAG